MAIRYHMGDFSDRNTGKVYEMCPLALQLHVADLQATYLGEARQNNKKEGRRWGVATARAGPYEGLYFIDNEGLHVYRSSEASAADGPETRLLRELDYEELTGGRWLYDDLCTEDATQELLDTFADDLMNVFRASDESLRDIGSPRIEGRF